MNKKILALVLALVMCLSLAACGDKPAPGNSNEPSNPQSSSEPKNTTSQPENTPDNTEPQGGNETTAPPNAPTDKDPEGKTKYVMEGGVVYYPTDTWEAGAFGGIQPKNCEDEELVVRVGAVAGSVDEEIEVFKSDYSNYQSVEKMTIADHNAAKCIYVGDLGTHMVIFFDTPYSNDEYYKAYRIIVRVSEDNTAFFDDPTLWEIIETFHYDASLKYSF